MRSEGFFRSVFSGLSFEFEKVVVVTHLVSGVDEFIFELNRCVPVAAVLPKPNSMQSEVVSRVSNSVPLLSWKREEIKSNPEKFLLEVSRYAGGVSYAVIDTGGYFSHVLGLMTSSKEGGLVGVVEDTENGQQKYEAILSEIREGMYPCPVMSVARSPLKDAEDFLVGQAVVFSADAVLRESGLILGGKDALVLGYGKIGSSIANYLRLKGCRVFVCDACPIRMSLAASHGFAVTSKIRALKTVDMVFAATGNGSLCEDDFASMRNGSYVFTATSGDDEIVGYHELLSNSSGSFCGKSLLVGGRVHLCNNGNSANFLHGGVVGPFIKLVQAELVHSLSTITSVGRSGIATLDRDARARIADTWLSFYSYA